MMKTLLFLFSFVVCCSGITAQTSDCEDISLQFEADMAVAQHWLLDATDEENSTGEKLENLAQVTDMYFELLNRYNLLLTELLDEAGKQKKKIDDENWIDLFNKQRSSLWDIFDKEQSGHTPEITLKVATFSIVLINNRLMEVYNRLMEVCTGDNVCEEKNENIDNTVP